MLAHYCSCACNVFAMLVVEGLEFVEDASESWVCNRFKRIAKFQCVLDLCSEIPWILSSYEYDYDNFTCVFIILNITESLILAIHRWNSFFACIFCDMVLSLQQGTFSGSKLYRMKVVVFPQVVAQDSQLSSHRLTAEGIPYPLVNVHITMEHQHV